MAIPLRGDFDASDLRTAARRSKDAAQARRLLALAAVYDGASRTEAARIGGVAQVPGRGVAVVGKWPAGVTIRGRT